jgi:hypothetical protein
MRGWSFFFLNGGFTAPLVLGSITEWTQTYVIASQKEGLLQGYTLHIRNSICAFVSYLTNREPDVTGSKRYTNDPVLIVITNGITKI